MKEQTNYSLLNNNTFGIDVKCSSFIEYSSLEELTQFVKSGQLKKEPFLQIGGGSNLLFLRDFNGIVLHSLIRDLSIIREDENVAYIKAGSGLKWDDFVEYCVNRNLYGAENLSYIPGEVGASPVQNVGAYGVEAKDIIDCVELIDVNSGELLTVTNAECQFSYRNSIFKNQWKNKYIVHHVVFHLSKNQHFNLEYGNIKAELEKFDEVTLKNVRTAIINIRKNKLPDPSEIGSAGSFFKNPIVDKDVFDSLQKSFPQIPFYLVEGNKYKIPAGWMIDQSGWKGKSLGKVGVYEKQALILVNRGGASGNDVKNLSDAICSDVKSKFGVEISPEVCFIG